MNKKQHVLAVVLTLLCCMTNGAIAQVGTEVPDPVPNAKAVRLDTIKVHGSSLEGNLEGNAADREVLVFLPPGYNNSGDKRYPVVYALHGYSIGAKQWTNEIHVPQTIEGAFALGVLEMIVVLPDSKTMHNGSMYSSSVTTGDFENFIANDLVNYIDANYRTIPERRSRGLVGHSMGGYGAARIGMKHADVFGSLYIMSAGLLSPRPAGDPGNLEETAAAMTSPSESAGQPFFVRAQLAVASAWSPNPQKPPLYVDLPYENGEVQPDVIAKWAANAPLAFIDQYVGSLKKYHGISIDVGDQDSGMADNKRLHELMERYGIEHGFEIYSGTHTSKVALRFQNHVLPFFGNNLCGVPGCK